MERPLVWLTALNQMIARIAAGLGGALLLSITVVVLASVFFRYVVNSSLAWSEELTRYLAVWLVFLGMAPAYRAGHHVRVGVVVDRLSVRWRRLFYIAAEVVILFLLCVITAAGWLLAEANFTRDQLTPALRIPIAWIYLAIPVGLLLMALQSAERVVRLLVERSLPRSASTVAEAIANEGLESAP